MKIVKIACIFVAVSGIASYSSAQETAQPEVWVDNSTDGTKGEVWTPGANQPSQDSTSPGKVHMDFDQTPSEDSTVVVLPEGGEGSE